MPKKDIHPKRVTRKVIDINGFEFEIVTTGQGDIKVETSHLSHPAYNPDKVIKKIVKGRLEKFYEQEKKISKAA